MTNKTLYDRSFFETVRDGSNASATEIVPLVLQAIECKSVVDVGCGIGTWLSAFLAAGISEVLGIDGNYVDRSMLQMDHQHFLEHDLTQPLRLARKFDLALCLEVAEHLPEASGETLVETLIGLSDQILFSAAIPGQLGTGHINPQWQSYWISKFQTRGYACIDCIRPVVWRNPNVKYWYAQNMFLFASAKQESGDVILKRDLTAKQAALADIVHPMQQDYHLKLIEMTDQKLQWALNPGVLGLLGRLPVAIRLAISRRLASEKR